MIIRILGEGQYDVPDSAMDRLNVLDSELQSTVDTRGRAGFADALARLLEAVRGSGTAVPHSVLIASELILPAEGTDIDELGALLGDEGLIPG